MTGISLNVARLDLGANDGVQDVVTVNGRNSADGIGIAMAGGLVTIDGLSVRLTIANSGRSEDVLQVRGGEGNDTIQAATGVVALIQTQLEGNAGNDMLIGDGTLIGGLGNDTLLGGTGDGVLLGGAGNDVIAGSDGNDLLLGDAESSGVGASIAVLAIATGPGNDLLAGGDGDDVLKWRCRR